VVILYFVKQHLGKMIDIKFSAELTGNRCRGPERTGYRQGLILMPIPQTIVSTILSALMTSVKHPHTFLSLIKISFGHFIPLFKSVDSRIALLMASEINKLKTIISWLVTLGRSTSDI